MHLIKQPNGKFCCNPYSIGDFKYNLSEQDIIGLYVHQAHAAMGAAYAPGSLIEDIATECTVAIDNEMLSSMGYDKPYEELVKYVPRKPLDQSYASCEFATFGKCPSCGKSVRDGMGHRDEKCPHCGQQLQW